jgi:RNA polymerase sigma factor (TIGR02999 family)
MQGEGSAAEVRRLMAAFRQGKTEAASELVELFYPQLRRIAESRMRRSNAVSWQPTLLVNELYLELVKVKALRPPDEDKDERSSFLSLANTMMKRLLIHRGRRLSQRVEKVEFDEEDTPIPGFETVAEIESALSRLGSIRPRLRTIVELRIFEGLTGEEIAERLECSPSTVARDWDFANYGLQREFSVVIRD